MRVGYRFLPTDVQLINYFLKSKLDGLDSLVDKDIKEINIYNHEPWELPRYAVAESTDEQWYFFHEHKKPRGNGRSTGFKRRTNAGYWKSTGKQREIWDESKRNVIGTVRFLVFKKNCALKQTKTEWVIHEYHAKQAFGPKRNLVICVLMKKRGGNTSASVHDEAEPTSHDEAEPTHSMSSYSKDHTIEVRRPASPFNDVGEPDCHLGSRYQDQIMEHLHEPSCHMLSYPQNHTTEVQIPLRENFFYKLENKADAPHDEGERSCAMASDVDNHVAQSTQFSQVDLDAVLQSLRSSNALQPQMQMEQGFSLEHLASTNFFNNEPDRPTFQFDYGEEGVDPIQLADSFLDVPVEFYSEETAQTLLHGYRPPQSLRKVYVEDNNDTDSDVIHRESSELTETSKQFQQMRMVQALTEALLSSNHEQGGLGRQIQQVTKISKHQEPPKSPSFIKQEGNSPGKDVLQMSSPVSRDEGGGDGNPGVSIKQGFGGMVSEKDKKTVKVTIAKTDVKLRSNVSAVDNKENSFISFETPASIHKSNSQLVDNIIVAVGVVLFIFFISELLEF